MRTTVISAVVAGAVAVAGAGTAHAADAVAEKAAVAQSAPLKADALRLLAGDAGQLEELGTEDEVLVGVEELFTTISEIPDSVLAQGEEATQAWLEKKVAGTDAGGAVLYAFSMGGCAKGILQAIGSNIFAVAKIYKMKKAIDKLGGIKKVINKIRDKKKKGKTFKKGITEVFEEAGAGLGAIAIGMLGVDGVIKNCW
ncbi:hypothetical protein [Streptomyces sp. NPDC059063]|uniref:hypothetical protein n=1 Tax=unclassified Streptomyces TaxID=2593676 RepID=UPI00368BF8D1